MKTSQEKLFSVTKYPTQYTHNAPQHLVETPES